MSEDLRKVSLPVSGMTCAACARRVEKALSGTAGVRAANVNLAAEKATAEYDPALVGPEDLAGAVEGAGYGVVLEEERVEDAHAREYKRLRSRFLVAAVLTVFILIGSLPPMLGIMLPIPMGWLNLGLLLLATPVQFWFALAVAFVAAFPVNRWLIVRGRGHAVVHDYHDGHGGH